jgi:hypothetical protein
MCILLLNPQKDYFILFISEETKAQRCHTEYRRVWNMNHEHLNRYPLIKGDIYNPTSLLKMTMFPPHHAPRLLGQVTTTWKTHALSYLGTSVSTIPYSYFPKSLTINFFSKMELKYHLLQEALKLSLTIFFLNSAIIRFPIMCFLV